MRKYGMSLLRPFFGLKQFIKYSYWPLSELDRGHEGHERSPKNFGAPKYLLLLCKIQAPKHR